MPVTEEEKLGTITDVQESRNNRDVPCDADEVGP
jgi:hypothetical protein